MIGRIIFVGCQWKRKKMPFILCPIQLFVLRFLQWLETKCSLHVELSFTWLFLLSVFMETEKNLFTILCLTRLYVPQMSSSFKTYRVQSLVVISLIFEEVSWWAPGNAKNIFSEVITMKWMDQWHPKDWALIKFSVKILYISLALVASWHLRALENDLRSSIPKRITSHLPCYPVCSKPQTMWETFSKTNFY